MGQVVMPQPVKLIISVFGLAERFEEVECALVAQYGVIDWRSARLPFDHTRYYEHEFGGGLERVLLAFDALIDPGDLPDIKLWTNDLEQRWAVEGRRTVNLDPGYVSAAKLVLATTKNHSHRIYLSKGIYAEVTLSYCDKAFRPLPWTYPDYGSAPYIAMMHEIRRRYRRQLRERARAIPRSD